MDGVISRHPYTKLILAIRKVHDDLPYNASNKLSTVVGQWPDSQGIKLSLCESDVLQLIGLEI